MAAKPIRLFIPTGVYPPDIGGPAAYVPLVEKFLPAHGFSVSVLPFRRVRFLPKGFSHFAYFLLCLKGALHADIVYAQDAVSVGVPSYIASMICRRTFVVKIVGDHVWEQGRARFGVNDSLDDFPLWPRALYLRLVRHAQLFVVRGARVVIVPGNYLKKIVLSWGISEERVKVVYNGIELPHELIEPNDPPHPLIVSIARLAPWKGLSGIMDSIKGEDWNLTIVGDGPSRAALEAHAREAGVAEQVRFTGALPNSEALGWAKRADVYVLNSSYEGLPHTIIEVMNLGVSIVASDIPGNREVLTHGREGLLVPAGDSAALKEAIRETLSDTEARERRITAARIRASEFSAEQTVSELARVLSLLCA